MRTYEDAILTEAELLVENINKVNTQMCDAAETHMFFSVVE
jgi:hypothetical protein